MDQRNSILTGRLLDRIPSPTEPATTTSRRAGTKPSRGRLNPWSTIGHSSHASLTLFLTANPGLSTGCFSLSVQALHKNRSSIRWLSSEQSPVLDRLRTGDNSSVPMNIVLRYPATRIL